LRTGFICRGHITTCGADVIVILGADGRRTVIRTDQIDNVAVESQETNSNSGRRSFTTGDHEPSATLTFESVLRDLYAYEAAATLITQTAQISETVQYIGTDVVVVANLRFGSTAGNFAQYVRLASVIAVITE
jgi:hypothetical protein